MTENNCKRLESSQNLQSNIEYPEQFEAYRNNRHREIAAKWPIVNEASETKLIKSTTHSKTHLRNKSNLNFVGDERSHSQLSNVTSTNQSGASRNKSESNNRILQNASEFAFDEYQQNAVWNSKAQQGIIAYHLPDGLPDGAALCSKLQTLLNTNTIYLNDRHFWNALEHRFKTLREKNFRENMERLRRNQQNYEQELIAKGILPCTTEEAIQQHVKEQREKLKMNSNDSNISNHRKTCTLDYNVSDEFSTKNEAFEQFESDNVHPRLHEIVRDYKFQTKLGQQLGEDLQNDLLKAQAKLKTIFPKSNQQDRIRRELEVVKTSEGLYSYSNRLAKQALK